MSHLTSPGPSPDDRTAQSFPAVGTWLFGGAVAAGLGLGALAALTALLWITSPYPDSGAGGALHIAADLWLLAHGTPLVRTGTLSGAPAPVGLTPLLLSALPVWLLIRATQHGMQERDLRGDGRSAAAVVGWVCGGYLLVGALAVFYASGGPMPPDPVGAVVHLPLLVGCVTGVTAWSECGHPVPPRLWPDGDGGERTRDRILAAVRTASLATAVLCAGGALLLVVGVLRNAGAAVDAFPQLTSSWSGRAAVLLLALALIPNAAVWGAAYGLGPGFTLGGGSFVGPLGAGGYPALPHFPLLAGLPPEGSGGPLVWAVAGAVPLAAGTAAGWCAARAAVPLPHVRAGADTVRGTAGTMLLSAAGCGVAVLLLVTVGSGPLGTGTLAHFGPDPWLSGLAAAVWTALLGVPTALTVRVWRLRGSARAEALGHRTRAGAARPAVPAPQGKQRKGSAGRRFTLRRRKDAAADWHTTGARRTRWAALKETSDELMSEFGPRPGAGPRPVRDPGAVLPPPPGDGPGPRPVTDPESLSVPRPGPVPGGSTGTAEDGGPRGKGS